MCLGALCYLCDLMPFYVRTVVVEGLEGESLFSNYYILFTIYDYNAYYLLFAVTLQLNLHLTIVISLQQ